MLQLLRKLAARIRDSFPTAAEVLENFARRLFGRWIATYPRVLANEVGAVRQVLYSSRWNMAYGKGLVHERLEDAFCSYIGSSNAVAVNTGGMALQMALRALGLKPGDEAALQVDTCSATAFAALNAGVTPLFTDVSLDTFMMDTGAGVIDTFKNARAVIATHMWGNPESLDALTSLCREKELPIIEDACLALGTVCGSGMAGIAGTVGVFSFGCLKPIQGGEGGMLVTKDDALARELRSLRHWGDRTIDYGVRDTTQLAWNGRMSELVAAVVREQLRGYPAHLAELRARVGEFQKFLSSIDGVDLHLGMARSIDECAFTQVVVRTDPDRIGMPSKELRTRLDERGIATWLPNFEPIPSLSFFAKDHWKDWILKGRLDAAEANYHAGFVNAETVANMIGLGFPKQHFTSKARLRHLVGALEEILVGP
jgi:dTDP-4-amino-4,6-dideoxygalactose transaminase